MIIMLLTTPPCRFTSPKEVDVFQKYASTVCSSKGPALLAECQQQHDPGLGQLASVDYVLIFTIICEV